MQVAPGPLPPGILTTGEARIQVRPDAAIVTVGAVVQAASAQVAQSQLAERIGRVLERIKALAIDEKDFRTVAYRIDPQYVYEPNTAPRLTGYLGTQQIALTLHGTDGVGKVLDALVQDDGATTAAVAFVMLDGTATAAVARQQAIQHARTKAEAMAKTAGVTVGKVVSVSDADLPMRFDGAPQMFMARSMQPANPTTDLPAGQLDVVVRVQVQFEIG